MPYCTLLPNFLQGEFSFRCFLYSKDFDIKEGCINVLFVCPVGMERPTQCSTLVLWSQRLKKPSMAKPEM